MTHSYDTLLRNWTREAELAAFTATGPVETDLRDSAERYRDGV